MRIFVGKEFNTLTHLLDNGTIAVTEGWTECLIIAIGASSPTQRTVAIGTGKATIESNLLHFATQTVAQERAEIIIIETCIGHYRILEASYKARR
jgi:hypothetical protein